MVDIKHNSARRPLAMLLLSLLFVASGCNTLFNRGRQPTDFSEDQGWRPLGWKDNKSRKVDTEQQDDEPESSRRRSSRRQADRTQDKERSGEKQTSDSDRNEKKQDVVSVWVIFQNKLPFLVLFFEYGGKNPHILMFFDYSLTDSLVVGATESDDSLITCPIVGKLY